MKTEANAAITPSTDLETHECYPGLTKREYFAAKALEGLLASPELVEFMSDRGIADSGVFLADALIAALNKGEA